MFESINVVDFFLRTSGALFHNEGPMESISGNYFLFRQTNSKTSFK